MKAELKRAREIYAEEGIYSLLKSILNYIHYIISGKYIEFIRPNLPDRLIVYSGVPTYDAKLLDQHVPFRTPERDYPEYYEYSLVNAIRKHAFSGDNVVIIGGGIGVSTTVAARRVRPSGKVNVYEGALDYVKEIHSTIQLNNVSNFVEVHHAIVGEELNLHGNANGANKIRPTQLPECDLLEFDCEGAELGILQEMDISPKTIVVESHGHIGSSSDKIKHTLQEEGYTILSQEIAEIKEKNRMCLERDIYVIVAEKVTS
jgi:hypothetical protein